MVAYDASTSTFIRERKSKMITVLTFSLYKIFTSFWGQPRNFYSHGSYASWKLLEIFSLFFGARKVLENVLVAGKSWKLGTYGS